MLLNNAKGLENLKNPKAFTEFSNHMQDVYKKC